MTVQICYFCRELGYRRGYGVENLVLYESYFESLITTVSPRLLRFAAPPREFFSSDNAQVRPISTFSAQNVIN
jgi:hypothetical protein